MSNITSYPGIQLIENDDLMVISDVSQPGNPTRTVSIGTLSTVFETGGGSTNNILGIYPILVTNQGLNTTISIAGGVYQDKLTLSTNGTSGPATLLGSNLNIPQYSGGDGGGNSLDRFMLTGMIKTLGDDSKYGPDPGGANYQPMEWTSAGTNDDRIPLWRTPIQAKLELVTWAYMGDALTIAALDMLDFNIGVIEQGMDSVITNFSPISTMFSLGFEANNTRPQGQLDVSSKNIVLNEFQNIAVVMNQRAGSTITPTDGDFAICLYFRATTESGGGDPGDGERYTVTLTDIVDNVVGEPGTYAISGNAIGDFVQGVNGTSWGFRNEVIPATGYEVTNATATNPSGSINGQDEDVINIIGGTVSETSEDRFTVTMTPLVNNIVNNDGISYSLNGDADAATREGIAGGIWNFTTGIDPLPTGYYIDGFTATNPSGVFSADVSVQQEVGGEIKSKDSGGTDRYTVTLSPFNDNIIVPGDGLGSPSFGSESGSALGGDTGDGPQYYTLGGDLAGATQTGIFGTPYAFNTTITLASGYEWRVQPTVTNPSGTIPGNDTSVAQTITGEIQESTTGKDQFTVTLSPLVDAITLPSAEKGPTGPTSEYYTITGASQGDSVTGPTGTNYAFNNGITMQSGWTIENFNPNNLQGIIGTSNITRSKTITGQVVAEAQDQVTVTYKLSDFIADTDPPHYTLTGNTDQDTVTGAPGDPYSFSTGIQVDSGYSINNFTSTDPSGVIPASDVSVSASVTGTIVQDTEQTFTVTSAWNDQITQSSGALSGGASSFGPTNPPYTITGDVNGATVTGTTGTSYSFNNVVTANSGYTFTEGPTVSNPSGTIGNSNQTVSQVFTGVIVEDSAPPGDPGVVWRVVAPTGPGSGEVTSISYTKINGNTDTITILQNAGDQCICVLEGTTPVVIEAGPGGGVEQDASGATCNTAVNGISCPAGS